MINLLALISAMSQSVRILHTYFALNENEL